MLARHAPKANWRNPVENLMQKNRFIVLPKYEDSEADLSFSRIVLQT